MSRYHNKGRDPWQTMPETQWQRERRLGPILPMSEERPGLLRRMLGGSRG